MFLHRRDRSSRGRTRAARERGDAVDDVTSAASGKNTAKFLDGMACMGMGPKHKRKTETKKTTMPATTDKVRRAPAANSQVSASASSSQFVNLAPASIGSPGSTDTQATNNTVVFNNMHDYLGVQMEASVGCSEEFPLLPVSPAISPAVKQSREDAMSDAPGAQSIEAATSTILKEFSCFGQQINKRLDTLESMITHNAVEIADVKQEVKDNTREIAAMKNKFEAVHREFVSLKNQVMALESQSNAANERSDVLAKRITHLETYSRRWNLKLYGLEEREQQDLREEIIRLCQVLIPEARDLLSREVDIVHRLGPKKNNSSQPRGVIMQFISRRLRDEVWRAAKNSTFLKNKNLKLAEDLSPDDRERRRQLWPAVEKARKENQLAYYVGSRAFINGREIFPP
ncbi:hypothetical protein WMY93_033206 [Mugilogobius chulae]|uniref:Uncharacterized protein n=1 Tax=Mugilogobius chulae TaxID=88201 RepID=A0AAW0MHR7_9GOBI